MARPPGHGPNFEIKRQEIIDIAAALFAKRGYAATSTVELCAATGLAKGALYYYIQSKENLLVEIQDRVMTPLLSDAHRIAALDADPAVRLRLLSEALLRVIFERLDHIWVYERDYRQLGQLNRARFMTQRREFELVVTDLVIDAMRVNLFRPMDARLAVVQFLNLHNHTYQWAHPGGEWDAEMLSRAYCKTLMKGFAAEGVTFDYVDEQISEMVTSHPGLFGACPTEPA